MGCGSSSVSRSAPDATEAQTLKRAPAGVRLACRATRHRAGRSEAAGRRLARPRAENGAVPPRCRGRRGGRPRDHERQRRRWSMPDSGMRSRHIHGAQSPGAVRRRRPVEDDGGAGGLRRARCRGSPSDRSPRHSRSPPKPLRLAPRAIVRVAIAGNTAMALAASGSRCLSDWRPTRSSRHSPRRARSLRLTAAPAAIPALAWRGRAAARRGLRRGRCARRGARDRLLGPCGVAVLLVDVGTNAEIVLRSDGRLVVASAAAGPAFEGWAVSSGGRAGRGAVDRVVGDRRGHSARNAEQVRRPSGSPARGSCPLSLPFARWVGSMRTAGSRRSTCPPTTSRDR